MIKGIASDLDGTLIDTAKLLAEAWEEAFKSEGVAVGYSELYKNTKGISSKDIIRKYKKESSPEDLNRIKEKRKSNFINLVDQGSQLLYPETIKVINEIRGKKIKFDFLFSFILFKSSGLLSVLYLRIMSLEEMPFVFL